jgi:DNA-binding response OmpR family regulator
MAGKEPPQANNHGLRILVVDDDPDALRLIEHMLHTAGYASRLAGSGRRALEMLLDEPADVVLLDLGLPDLPGLEVLRRVHNYFGCQVVVLTGDPTVQTAISALRGGAVDYLTKPLLVNDLVEAIARVEARRQANRLLHSQQAALTVIESGLRRLGQAGIAPAAAERHAYQVGPVRLDLDRHTIEVNGRPIEATPTEVDLLHYLCRYPERVTTARELIEAIRGYRVEADQAAELVRPHLSNLRRKLRAADPAADVVSTVRGVGYMLREPPKEA